ncbi:MAG TPA: aldehyde dehydrogenase family protein [Chryseosolibacter sp.]
MAVATDHLLFEDIDNAFSAMKNGLLALRTEPIKNRKERLAKLRSWIHTHRTAIHEAMYADFRKPSVEVDAIEIFHVLNEIKLALTNLEDWARPKKIDAPITMIGTRSVIQYEPRGLCLVISPWNYPFSLAVGPMVSALAAGNAIILKPSEMTPRVSSLLKSMVKEIFDDKIVTVFEGGPEVSKHLLTLPFDHIFFTGSPAIGKVVMKAAADNLTSVTLELGGKSPTVITASANINDAAQRTAVAKFVNNGQTCVAPDYIFVDEKIAAKYTEAFIRHTKKLFADNGNFETSNSYCRIVNDKHFARLNDLLQDALTQGAKLELGGNADKASRFMPPMVLTQVPASARIMNEEIFGPIVPIISYSDLGEVISSINSKPKALALYVYSNDRATTNRILRETSSGAACVNESGIHFLHHNLPFGGVNNSGIGKSHGHYGFLAFSNEKPVLKQKSGFTSVRAFYPPYTSVSKKLMDWFLKLF